MEISKREADIYSVYGKEFLSKVDAEAYEKELLKDLGYVYYIVTYSPDLTEGRGYGKQMVIAVPEGYTAEATALQFCFDTIGKPLEFIMGASPTPNWVLGKPNKFRTLDELAEFRKKKLNFGIGDYRRHEDMKIAYLDYRGKVAEER